MNFKFENDVENNMMTVHVTVSLRKKINEEKKLVSYQNIIEIIDKNYKPPATHDLGKLTSNIHLKLDNSCDSRLTGQWIFSLVPKKAKKSPARSTKTKAIKKSNTK